METNVFCATAKWGSSCLASRHAKLFSTSSRRVMSASSTIGGDMCRVSIFRIWAVAWKRGPVGRERSHDEIVGIQILGQTDRARPRGLEGLRQS